MATTYERFPFHEPRGPDTHLTTTPESSVVGNSTAYESHHNGLQRSSMGKCFLQWFWSTLMIDGSSTQDSQAKPSNLRHGQHHGEPRKDSTYTTQGTSTAYGNGLQEQSHDNTDEDVENPSYFMLLCGTLAKDDEEIEPVSSIATTNRATNAFAPDKLLLNRDINRHDKHAGVTLGSYRLPQYKMEAEYTRLAETIRQKADAHSKKRFLVAVAGIPGSGKTTTAAAVARRLNAQPSPKHTTLLSMDGFHLPRATLDLLPNREEAYIRRGAPWTFDAARFVQFIRRLRDWADSSAAETIYAPSFDHKAKDPIENGISITNDMEIVIIEGNYLLLDEPEWREVAALVDYRVFVESDLQEARERVARRHVLAGIEKTLEDGFRRVDSNDYLNAVTIQEKLIAPDMVIHSVTEPSC
ncbi:hypothetical protein CNMCM5793_008709 [Aspergillus hiratsukae]|uniref:Phosphoribulokinase/uridine kinase domain-containing protein n=1 Tax=Aspergillus hiratsukae TaxID=1194566 RepID=A0A8H6UQJ7_9EURO|nr:hypothetical protein CNMCM5793_008709 [Aspergillus hiratsukae]KAF7159725.1 hypothetical protein CNMCM6106_007127 [Aspergillus hiratsukae]